MIRRTLVALLATVLAFTAVLRRRALAIAALVVLAAAFATPAHAAVASAQTSSGVVLAFSLDPLAVVQFVVAFVLPILVGLVTTRVTSAAVQAWSLAGLNLATSLAVELVRAIEGETVYDVGAALFLALPAFAISVAGHYGLWKPTQVTARALDSGRTPSTHHDADGFGE